MKLHNLYTLRTLKLVLLGLAFTIAFISCKKDEDNRRPVPAPRLYQEYFPLKVGSSWTYQLDTIKYNGNSDIPVDSTKLQIKEQITDLLDSSAAIRQYRIARYKRSNDNAPWQLIKVYTTSISSQSADVTENNRRLVKLSFPVQEGRSWYAHMYTADSIPYNSSYGFVHKPYTVQGKQYDSATQVRVQYDTSLVNRNVKLETYGYRVGLIQAIYDSLDIQPVNDKFTYRGFKITKKLLKYE